MKRVEAIKVNGKGQRGIVGLVVPSLHDTTIPAKRTLTGSKHPYSDTIVLFRLRVEMS